MYFIVETDVYCQHPQEIVGFNGRVEQSFINKTVTFTCDNGYEIYPSVVSLTVDCSCYVNWTSETPTCTGTYY